MQQHRTYRLKLIMLAAVCLCSMLSATAGIKLPKLISDGMVLQRDTKLKIWGWADPGDSVSLGFSTWGRKLLMVIAGEDGRWSISLPPQKAGGPYTMSIATKDSVIFIKDILVGDIWLCSGQSNMELSMDRLRYKYPGEMAGPGNPYIRQFLVPDIYAFKEAKQDLFSGNWLPATPANLATFGGVGYFFAQKLYARYKVPIGLINAALGGSPAEAWISEEALKQFPAYYNDLQLFKDDEHIKKVEAADRATSNEWYGTLNKLDEGLRNNWRQPDFNDNNWQEMQLPGYWSSGGKPYNGALWFRKTIWVPPAMAGQSAKLELGRIIDADSVFVNGKFAGTTGYQYPPRRYLLPAGWLTAGYNTIAIRVVNTSGRGGFVQEKPYRLTTATDTINLAGTWKYINAVLMPPLVTSGITVRFKPGGLYNAMIAPLLNYAIKGALWYQGESNAGRPADYRQLMEALITDWRGKWQQGNFPFLWVQLPNYMEATTQQQETGWQQLRQQQLQTLTVPNTGMTVAIDLGEWNELHPENKKGVGERLALLAMQKAYGDKKIVASGPLYTSMRTAGNKIILQFTHTGSGLVAKGGELRQFAIAGADGKFVWAQAAIQKNTVVVWSEAVAQPVAVRYAWANNPEGANLYNKEGLPASPFNTISK